MPKLIALSAIVALLATSGTAHAKPAPPAEPVPLYDVNLILDGAVIAASVSATIGIYAFAAGSIDKRCPCDRQEVNPIDRFAVGNDSGIAAAASNVTVGAALIVPVILDWFAVGTTRSYFNDLVVYAESIAVAGALAVTFKQIVQRPLPRTYAGDPALIDSPSGYRSFYSGHTTLAFAALSTASVTITERYGETWVPWVVTAGVGASVAVERVAAGWHFPTDVMAGALAGAAIGVAVPVLHLHRLRLMPFVSAAPGTRNEGLTLAGVWR
jgi:membrane-associated phospholipid phosphatase